MLTCSYFGFILCTTYEQETGFVFQNTTQPTEKIFGHPSLILKGFLILLYMFHTDFFKKEFNKNYITFKNFNFLLLILEKSIKT